MAMTMDADRAVPFIFIVAPRGMEKLDIFSDTPILLWQKLIVIGMHTQLLAMVNGVRRYIGVFLV